MLYSVGETFPAGDGCNDCSCDEFGGVSCTEAVCEPPTCESSAECSEGSYCAFERQDCGEEEGSTGYCAPRPDGCPPVDEGHFCGCGGSYANSACTLAQRGEDLQVLGGCDVTTGDQFVCGEQTCAVGQTCNISWNDVIGPGEPLFYASCAAVTCDAADPCDCVIGEPGVPVTCEQRGGHTFIFYPGG